MLLILLPSIARAQVDAGALRALVIDQSGGVIPGATVTLTNDATGVTRDVLSDGEGYVTFSPIQRGTYTLRIALNGFRPREIKDITVDVNERKFVRVTIEAAGVSETVEVTGNVATLQTEDGSLGHVIKGDVATQLPLAGRRYTELALLVPGATPSTMTLDTRGPGWFLVNGNTQTQNNFMLDGFDNNNGTQNAQSLSSQVVQPNPDAIDQFKVQTNSFSAEFGRSAGAVVNVSIKSGSNQPHGSAWYYNRDASLASISWNAAHNNLPKDDLAWNQAGLTFGGPLVKNKLFYFGSYEGFDRSFSQSGVVSVPDAAMRTGVFPMTIVDPLTGQPFPNNTIPRDRWDPLAAKILDAWSLPNRAGTTSSTGINTNNYAYQAPGTEKTHKVDVRGDLVSSTNNRFFVRYSLLRQRIYRDQILDGIVEQAGNQGEQYNLNHNLGISWNRFFSGRYVNEMRVGYTATNADFAQPTATGMKADEFGFAGLPPSQLTTGGIPAISISNYSQVGIRNFRPQFQNPRGIQFLDTVSALFGRHTLKMGLELRRKKDVEQDDERVSPAYTFNGTFTGNALADFMLGSAQSYVAVTNTVVDYRQQAYAAFLQDDFKISPNVTANLGLRYEYTTPMYGHGTYKNINFDPATGGLYSASDSDPYAQDADKNNVAPRVGLAWQVKPDTFVARAGYGIFYSGEEIHGSDDMMVFNPPQLIRAQLNASGTGPTATPAIHLSDPFPSTLLSNYDPTTVSVRAHQRDWNMPQVQQWNLAFETLLPWQSSFEVAYVGNRGSNEIVSLPLNAVQWGQNGSVVANRPFPQWQQITMFFTAAQSSYDSLQLKFEKRQSHGLYLLASYTFANAIEETGGWGAGGHTIQDNVLPDYSNLDDVLRATRGPNTQVARHRLTLTEVWQLPIGRGRAIGGNMSPVLDAIIGGWQLSSITSILSGLPVSVTLASSGTDPVTGKTYSFLNRNGGGILPNATDVDPNSNSSTDDLLHWLNPAAYAVQPVNTPGNANPVSAWGPGAWTTDLSLVKRFTFNTFTTDLRAEAFNLFNTVNYGQPNGTFGSASFGQITSAGDPRIIQLAVRIGF
ncbi:MAG TPA: carboxypeptidase regulatory-like domain-containing protein [Vicinamibacterales bacterium]|nr:carboxypeptidase regulatory-like domain-containing protein [Vicinamibacterales bacterium]